ncbi:MAG: hypothetical protein IPJ88_06355 [Myxococcales bacterium]|nr:MAG: hypothetical protein IPJ88_06355 [Myxococcales bacterium]
MDRSWQNRCADVLRNNEMSTQGFRYTRPAPHVYKQQWLWDSCFHAIVYRHFDPEMAWAELKSLVQLKSPKAATLE